MIQKILLYSVLLICSAKNLLAQNNYILQSRAPLPKEFNLSVDARLSKAREHLKSLNVKYDDDLLKEQMILFQGYIRSGQVLFNDSISFYLDKIAQRLFDFNRNLKNQVKVYLCKNDYAVNFCAPDGSIFISTGFIAQTTAESQLAFAIAREIVRWQKGYIQNLDVSLLNKANDVKSYNIYFHEFTDQVEVEMSGTHDYDEAAFQMTRDAGFDIGDALFYFDILLNAELPFEYVKFDKRFFESANFTIPNEFIKDTVMPVTHEENVAQSESPEYDDYAKRKENFGNVKSNPKYVPIVELNTYHFILKLAKLETCKQQLLRKSYNQALYNSYCMIKNDSEDVVAKEIFVQALFGFSLNKNEDVENYLKGLWEQKKISKLREYQFKNEEVSPVDTCIKILYKIKANNSTGIVALALRKCWEWSAKHPKSKYLAHYKKYLMASLDNNSNIKYHYFVFSKNDVKPANGEKNDDNNTTNSKYARLKKTKSNVNLYKNISDLYIQTVMMDITTAPTFVFEYENAVKEFNYIFSDVNTVKKQNFKINDKILQSSLDFDYLNMLKNENDPTREVIPDKEKVKIESLFNRYDKMLGGKVINMSLEETKLYNGQMWNDEVLINDYIYEIGNSLVGYRTNYTSTQFYAAQLADGKNAPYLFTGKFTKKIYHKDANTDAEDCSNCSVTSCLIFIDIYNLIVPSKKFLFEYYIIDFKTGSRVYHNANDDYIPFKDDMLKAHIYDILYQLTY